MTAKQKEIVQIFHLPDSGANSAGCGPTGCGPGDAEAAFSGCNCGSPAQGLEEMVAQFTQNWGDQAEVKMAEYSSHEAVADTLEALNRILALSNETLTVTQENLDMVLTQSAPIIAVGGKIVSTRIVPTADQLASVLRGESLKIVAAGGGCCG